MACLSLGKALGRLLPAFPEVQAIGTAAGMWAGGRASSDYRAKEGRDEFDGETALNGLKAVPIESWSYKDGEGPPGRQVGPMAQDANMMLGEKVAPGGKAIDMISMNGLLMSAVKQLAKEVDGLKKHGPAKVSRSTEPSREAA